MAGRIKRYQVAADLSMPSDAPDWLLTPAPAYSLTVPTCLDLAQSVGRLLARGVPIVVACQVVGVAPTVMQGYLAAVDAPGASTKLADDPTGPVAAGLALRQAVTSFYSAQTGKIAASEDWRAAAYLLELSDPAFRPVKQVQINALPDAALVTELCATVLALPDSPELRALSDRLRERFAVPADGYGHGAITVDGG